MKLFIGTYTSELGHVRGTGDGIHVCELDATTGLLTSLSVTQAENPSFLALHPSGSFLYAVNEAVGGNEAEDGTLSAYRISPEDKGLVFLDSRTAGGRAPCNLSVDPTGGFLLSANYWGGDFLVHRIQNEGGIGIATARMRNEGKGLDPDRQAGPHPHSLVVAPGVGLPEILVAGCDLGLDTVFIFSLDPVTGNARVNSRTPIHPGWGPRQIEFDPHGRRAYLMTEMAARVCVFDWIPAEGRLVQIQEAPVLLEDSPGPRHGADVRLSPDGTHAYATVRGADCVACFRLAPSGFLELVFREKLPGLTPRHAAVSPDGSLLLIACQDSHEVLVYRRDIHSGALRLIASNRIASPACIVFA